MKVCIETYWAPKGGCGRDEYEDAALPNETGALEVDDRIVHLAIADGATESAFARDWAQALVAHYERNPRAFHSDREVNEYVAARGRDFHQQLERQLSASNVPWYVEQKVLEGAFAALLGTTLDDARQPGACRWQAWAVGDCCLFQVHNEELVARFPLSSSAEFSSRPHLIASRPELSRDLPRYRRKYQGQLNDGDQLLLMTDALACWFLRRWERRSDPLELLAHIHSNEEFAKLVGCERREALSDGTPLLRNDDVTLIRCLIH